MSFASTSSLVLGAPENAPGESPPIAGRFDGEGILVPLLASDVPVVTDQIRVAASLARPTGASLHVLNPVTARERTPREFRSGITAADEGELLEWAVEQASSSARVDGGLAYTRRLVGGILEAVGANDVDALVVPSGSRAGLLHRGLTERLAIRADCDVVTVNGRSGYERIPSILLAVADGPHSGVATDVARRVATDRDAWIDVLHVVPGDASSRRRETAEAVVEAAYDRIDRPEATATWILDAADTAGAIVEQSAYYELTVVGAPTKGRLRRFISGSTNRSIRNDARSVVISARNNR